MHKYIIALVAMFAILFAAMSAEAAIELTTPEVIPQKTINAAKIVTLSTQFYTDGVDKALKPVVFVAWVKGTVTDGKFTEVSHDNMTINAEDFAAILLAAEQATPSEYLLGSAEMKTPMDKIYAALVAYLKTKGKL